MNPKDVIAYKLHCKKTQEKDHPDHYQEDPQTGDSEGEKPVNPDGAKKTKGPKGKRKPVYMRGVKERNIISISVQRNPHKRDEECEGKVR
jgi:hypothetical protein